MGYTVDIHAKLRLPRSRVSAAASATTNHMDRFLQVYEEIQTYLLNDAQSASQLDANRRHYLKRMMDVTCLGGKYNRGLAVVDVVDAMTVGVDAQAREEAIFDACVCGWMIEFMQAHFLVEDDIMDHSITRRGKPCWYRHPGVSTQVAINDGLIVFAWATEMAFHYLATKPFVLNLLQFFHRTDYRTTIGQLYDVTSMYDSEKLDPDVSMPTTTDYKEFTINHYKRIVRFKTAYYTYHAPLVMGALIAGSLTNEVVDAGIVENLAMLMGEYFQIQDDVLDCFADPAVLGKIGTDIQDCKCSWLAVTFMTVATPAQVGNFKKHYGKDVATDIAAIKALYAETKLEQKFEEFETQTVNEVERLLAAAHSQSPKFGEAAEKLWKKTYKRTK
jgi:farnesyl diphosphate synthase